MQTAENWQSSCFPGQWWPSPAVYFDCEHEVYNRSISQPEWTLDTDIIEALQEELHACNPHVRMFKGMDSDGENQDTHIVLCGPNGKSFG